MKLLILIPILIILVFFVFFIIRTVTKTNDLTDKLKEFFNDKHENHKRDQ